MTFWLPEPKLSIVSLTNRTGPGYSNQDMTLRLVGLAMGKPYPVELPPLDLTARVRTVTELVFRGA